MDFHFSFGQYSVGALRTTNGKTVGPPLPAPVGLRPHGANSLRTTYNEGTMQKKYKIQHKPQLRYHHAPENSNSPRGDRCHVSFFVIMGELLKCSNLQNFSIACGYQRKLATNAALRRVREERMAPSRSTETKAAAILRWGKLVSSKCHHHTQEGHCAKSGLYCI